MDEVLCPQQLVQVRLGRLEIGFPVEVCELICSGVAVTRYSKANTGSFAVLAWVTEARFVRSFAMPSPLKWLRWSRLGSAFLGLVVRSLWLMAAWTWPMDLSLLCLTITNPDMV
ncbi:hypothetical protein FKF78_16850 [Aeromonas hydrophila]|nr:hypothetical protein [Aeromonas hydrophila]